MRTRRAKLATIALCALGALAFAPQASLAQISSAEDQYVPHVPKGGGNEPTHELDPGDDPPPEYAQELAERGELGEAAAESARRTGPAPSEIQQGRGAEVAGNGLSPIAGLIEGLLGSKGGMGALLPVLLIVSLLGAGGYAVARRRGLLG